MKRISFFLATALLLAAPVIAPAQDAAMEERLNQLSAQIDVLKEAKELQNKKIEALEKTISELQAQANTPKGDYASAEDVKQLGNQLADKIKEVDKKRQADSENVADQLDKIRKAVVGGGSSGGRRTSAPPSTDNSKTFDATAPHMEYKVQSGDRLADIAKAYTDKGVKVTVQQILAANPGLVPEKMKTGQTIIIPSSGR